MQWPLELPLLWSRRPRIQRKRGIGLRPLYVLMPLAACSIPIRLVTKGLAGQWIALGCTSAESEWWYNQRSTLDFCDMLLQGFANTPHCSSWHWDYFCAPSPLLSTYNIMTLKSTEDSFPLSLVHVPMTQTSLLSSQRRGKLSALSHRPREWTFWLNLQKLLWTIVFRRKSAILVFAPTIPPTFGDRSSCKKQIFLFFWWYSSLRVNDNPTRTLLHLLWAFFDFAANRDGNILSQYCYRGISTYPRCVLSGGGVPAALSPDP